MGSVGKNISKSRASDLVSKLDKYDKRYSDDIVRAVEVFHREFPDFPEIKSIVLNENLDGIAGMNGLGMLSLNPKYLSDYDAEVADVVKDANKGWLAGNGDFSNTVVSHELGHHLDKQFEIFVTARAPEVFTQANVMDEVSAKAYSEVFGRTVNVGDVINEPAYNGSAIMFKIDGKGYSTNDLLYRANGLSGIVVPKAISNIQNNWQKFGFKSRPTERELVKSLSGYASWHGERGSSAYHTEVMAEAYSNYRSFGGGSNVLAQEIMRITKSVYRQVASNRENSYRTHIDKVVRAFSNPKNR